MSKEYMSQEELNSYEEVEISKDLVFEADKHVNHSFFREKFMEAIIQFEKTLGEGEYIISYTSGTAVDSNCKRAIMSVMGPGCYIANPMFFDWAIYSTLVKTNKGLYVIERGMYGKYIRSFKIIEDSLRLYFDDRILLEGLKEDMITNYNIAFEKGKEERLTEVLGDKVIKSNNKNHKTFWEKGTNKVLVAEIVLVCLFAIWMIYMMFLN